MFPSSRRIAAVLVASMPTGGSATAAVADTADIAVRPAAVCRSTRTHSPRFDAARGERIRSIVRKLVDRGAAPGAVIRIEQRGTTVLNFSYGLADREKNRPMQGEALFRLYSMTKPITSVAAMRLIERGELRLNDPVARYLPEFAQARVYGGDGVPALPLDRPVTVKDLLTHGAGLTYRTDPSAVGKIYAIRGIPAGPGVDAAPTDGSMPVTSLAELAQRVANTPLASQPGAAWTYGNGTDVLGYLLERVTGKPLQVVLQEEVLRPVRMRSTWFAVPASEASRLTAAYLVPAPGAGGAVLKASDIDALIAPKMSLIDPSETSIFAKPPAIRYAGAGLVGSAADYLRFTQMLRQGGTIHGTRLLSSSQIDQMRSDQIEPAARLSAATLGGLGFGYGFAVRTLPTAAEPPFPECGYFWGGAASTYFWVDPAGQTSGVLMTQVFGGEVRSFWLAVMREIYGPSTSGSGTSAGSPVRLSNRAAGLRRR
jgi:CubicO group peptidase (beta-lactamase class C family)